MIFITAITSIAWRPKFTVSVLLSEQFYCRYNSRISAIFGTFAISWSCNHNASIQWQAETSSQTKKLLDYLTITKAEAARPCLSI
jgi:hypothetical protein